MTLVFTLCSNNYLAQAITLGKSLLYHNPQYTFKIGLVDRLAEGIDYSSLLFEIIEVENIGIARFNEMFNRYTVRELNTAVKPFFFQHFFESVKTAERIIYLDPDIFVYNPFSDLEEALKENEIVLTPHFTKPIEDNKFQAENDFLNAGLYNLGFIALKRGEESGKLIEWWARRLETKAFIDFKKGLFTDQIWINFAPLFFNRVHLLKHPGYNMAYWNLHEREATEANEVITNKSKNKLVFFHFSGFDPKDPSVISKYQDRYTFQTRKDITHLFTDYAEVLFRSGYNSYIGIASYYSVEKQKLDLENLNAYKRSIPVYKRIFRGIILRIIRLFNINIEYYTS